jgi:L-arabinokinase
MIAAYVSGHGFGHATRTAEVLRVLRALDPGVPLAVVSSAPARLFQSAVAGPLLTRALACDVGLAQRDALEIDEVETVRAWRRFMQGWPALVEAEADWLRGRGVRLVLGDVPPLACAAAAAAGVPCAVLANFSWDWIYRHYAQRWPALGEAADWAADAYRRATLLIKLPFAGDLSVFRRIAEIPLVARRPRVPRDEARRRLGLGTQPVVLVSFGGIGLPGFDLDGLGSLRDFLFLTSEGPERLPPNVRRVLTPEWEALGLGYVDLVGAADVVLTKPGYGIVSDAIGAGCRMVYTDRGDFPEYPILTREMARYLPAVHVAKADLLAGRVREAIASALAMPFPETPDTSGADVAARRLLEMADS